MKQVEKKKKKNCADLGNLPWQPSAISKLHYSLFCFFLSLLSLSPSPSSLSSIYFLMPVQPINKMPLELAITSAIAVRLKEEATYWLTEGQMLFNICTLANKSK